MSLLQAIGIGIEVKAIGGTEKSVALLLQELVFLDACRGIIIEKKQSDRQSIQANGNQL
jgi:hypothetical protein